MQGYIFCFYLFEPVLDYFYKFVYITIYYWRQTDGESAYIFHIVDDTSTADLVI